MLTDKHKIEDITIQDIDNFCYAPARQEDLWKIDMVKELIEVRAEQFVVPRPGNNSWSSGILSVKSKILLRKCGIHSRHLGQ